MKIVFFDFDGTITNTDTFLRFIRFATSPFYYYCTFIVILFYYSLHILGFVTAGTAKKNILRFYFKNASHDRLNTIAVQYIEMLYAKKHIKSEMIELIDKYRIEGYNISVVSASMDLWVEVFCTKNNISCISTRLAFSDTGMFTGEFATPNCKGPEKVVRIKELYSLEQYDTIIVYGDSSGDNEMMAIATEKHWV